MNVIGHHDEGMELKTVPVSTKAGLHDDIARKVRKVAAVVIAALHWDVITRLGGECGDRSHTQFVMNRRWTGGAPVSPSFRIQSAHLEPFSFVVPRRSKSATTRNN